MTVSPSRHAEAVARVQAGIEALSVGEIAAARASLEAAIAFEPDWAPPYYYLARAHFAADDHDGAVAEARRAVALDPAYPAAAHLLGTLLCDRQGFAEARPWLGRAAALEPDNAAFQRDLGVVELFVGDLAAARTHLHRALALDPLVKDILPTLVRMTRMESGEAEAEQLFAMTRALADRLDELDSAEQVRVLFALGKALEDRGDYDAAFDAYARANAMHRGMIDYDLAADEARFAAVETIFNPALFERLGGGDHGAAGDRPIFIVGMPRSGTTLVEQIISAHPDVLGAGEDNLMQRLVGAATGPGGARFPHWAASMTEADLRAVGQACLEALPPATAGQSRVTIKRLENFEYLGLLHLCLPDATLIHCRRDQCDTCFSAFAMLFVEEQGFSYDLQELGRYWSAYDRLMAHWAAVLPPGRVLEVPYEAVVDDLEGWTRRLLAHCRLEWDDACLRYYESDRVVRSASFAQVREPIFTSSIGRWKPFGERLAPLFEAFGARGPEVPAQAGGTGVRPLRP